MFNFVTEYNLIPVNLLDICTGKDHSNANYNCGTESMIDYIFVNADKSDLVKSCTIPDDNALNVSSHRPVLCNILLPNTLSECNNFPFAEKVKWNRAKHEHITAYQNYFIDNNSVNLLSCDVLSNDDINNLYLQMVSLITEATNKCIPKSRFKHCLKPYWNSDLSLAHKNMKQQRWHWIESGRSRDPYNMFYRSYKQSKCKFRNMHRKCASNYLQKLNDDIDRAAELNITDFWKLVNARRNRSNVRAGVELEFDGTVYRDSKQITDQWGKYFRKLYTPSTNELFSVNVKNKVQNDLNNINYMLEHSDSIPGFNDVTCDEIVSTFKFAKKNKACGIDDIYYESIINGGLFIANLTAKLFTSMLKNSYTPDTMKRGSIITLHKGGNKSKRDPNNYRAITLLSVLLKLYERVILSRIEQSEQVKIHYLQGGFQKNSNCLMTSFHVREGSCYSLEHNSKLYIAFLDVRKAFDTV